MQLTITIAICIGVIFILIGSLCILDDDTRSTIRKILAAIFFIIGAINIICPIACNTIGTETKTTTKHDIYEVDHEYITWTGRTNNIANVYVKKRKWWIWTNTITQRRFWTLCWKWNCILYRDKNTKNIFVLHNNRRKIYYLYTVSITFFTKNIKKSIRIWCHALQHDRII